MSYKVETLRLSPNGLNLVAPADQVAPGDCIDLSGWHPGSVGRLQQANGFVGQVPDAAVPIRSLGEAEGIIYYGGGPNLYDSGHGATAIDTGYDTYPLGMTAYQKKMWVMNRNRQMKFDGTGTPVAWTPLPATAAPTAGTIGAIAAPTYAAGGVGTGYLLGPIQYIIAGVLTGHPSTEGECYRSAILTTISASGAPPIAPTAAPDPTWPGHTDLNKATITPPSFAVTGVTDVTHYNVYRLIGPMMRLLDPSFPDQFYRVNADPIPIGSTYTDEGRDGSAGGDPNQSDAALVQAGNTLNPLIEGGTKYYVTGVTDASEETSASPELVVEQADSVNVTAPSFAADPQVTKWNVYRQGGNNPPYLVNPDPILLGVTVYVDAARDNTRYAGGIDQSDDGVANLGQILTLGANLAPAARISAIEPYNGRIVVGSSLEHQNRIWWTPALQPAIFPGAAAEAGGQWADVGSDSKDEILAIVVKPGRLLIYRDRSIWQLIGDFDDPTKRLEPLMPGLGLVGPRALVATPGGDYALLKQGKKQGVYRITDWERRLSAKVDPVFNADTGMPAGGWVPMDLANRDQCALGYQLGRVWVSYPGPYPSTSNARTLILDVETGRWFNRGYGFGAYFNGSSHFLGAGKAGDGQYYWVEEGWDEAGGPSALALQTEFLDAGVTDHEKTWGDLVVNHYTRSATFTIQVSMRLRNTPALETITLDTVLSSTNVTKTVVPLVYPVGNAKAGKPLKSMTISIRISTPAAPMEFPGCFIDTPILLHYYLEARSGRSFDSGITGHGLEGVGQIDEIELDIDTSDGAATYSIGSDIPGGVMTDRLAAIAVAQTSGRQVYRKVLATPQDGRRFRHQLATTTALQLYSFRVRVLPIGVYLDGDQGEVWKTEPITLGV